ncbi:MAG: YbbR-like domain-containing protein [Saprospiraceae bacterium]
MKIPSSRFNPIYSLPTADRKLLLLSTAAAAFFWLILQLSQEYSIERPVNLAFELPERKTFAYPPPDQVTATLSGSGWNLIIQQLYGRNIQLDFSMIDDQRLPLTSSLLTNQIQRNLSSGKVRVTGLSFNGMDLELEDMVSVRLPIRSRITINYAEGFKQLGNIRISPDSVTLSGPAGTLPDFADWPTDTLVLTNLRADQELSLPLRRPARGLQLDTSSVTVRIGTEAYTQKSLFLPVTVRNAPPRDSLRLFPNQVRADVTVGLSAYSTISADSFEIVADMKKAGTGGSNAVPLIVSRRPENIMGLQLQQRSVEYYLIKRSALPAVDPGLD